MTDEPAMLADHRERIDKAGQQWRSVEMRLDDLGMLLMKVLRPREADIYEQRPRAIHELANLLPELVVQLLRRSLPYVECVEGHEDGSLVKGHRYAVVPTPTWKCDDDHITVINEQGEWYRYSQQHFDTPQHPEPVTDELADVFAATVKPHMHVSTTQHEWHLIETAFRLGANLGQIAAHGELDTAVALCEHLSTWMVRR